MSENYNDNDIEKIIFGGALASGAIEPSEKFWNKAYEDIIQRESRANLKRISKWKGASFFMGTVALLMGTYVIYMHTEVTNVKQQLTTIESTRVNTIRQNTRQTTVSNTTENPSAKNELSSTSREKSISQPNKETMIVSATTKSTNTTPGTKEKRTYNKYTASFTNRKATTATPSVANIASNSQVLQSEINYAAPRPSEKTATIINSAPITPPAVNETPKTNTAKPVVNAPTPKETSAEPASNEKVAQTVVNKASPDNNSAAAHVQSSSGQTTKAVATNKNTGSAGTAAIVDSASIVYPVKNPVTLAGILSKTSVSAFYAPGVTKDFLSDKNNDPTNTITANMLKTQQDGDGTYAIGLRLGYDISSRWTIQAGAYYSQHTYNINSTIIHAQQQENGQVGYSIATSSGTVFLPNSAIPAKLGDSIKVKGNSSRGYISIPLLAKFKFTVGTRFGFYIDGGASINIAKDKQTNIHWNNTALQEGDLTVQSIYGLNSVQYCYNFGLGASYLIGKGLSIYTEPFMSGSFTSINKDTPVITYPYFFGVAFGLTYHF